LSGEIFTFMPSDFNGTNIAHPFKASWIGRNKLNETDSNGVQYIHNLISVARAGNGFTYFIFPNPAHDNKDEFKVGHAMKVADDWWLGSGLYLSSVSASFDREKREELIAFVEEALQSAKVNGREKSLAAFDDRSGNFSRDGLHIFAYDYEGRILSSSQQPELMGPGDPAGRHQMLKTAADPNAYEIVYTLSENDFYFIISRDVPDTMVRAFQRSLEAVRSQTDAYGVSEYERIIYRYLGAGCARQSFSDQAVMALVNTTAAALEKDAPDTLRRINDWEAPYRDPTNPGLYAFVYTTNMTIAAHADDILLVGVNCRGNTDVTGRPFHEEIVQGALKNGTGWVVHIDMHPVSTNLYYKTTYYRLTQGSDGLQYIVCSSNYKRCQEE
jgi:signal transduction histidine kinase